MLECDVYQYLKVEGIDYRVVEHQAVYTIDEMAQANIKGFEYVVKNLFVRDDKKQHYYLIVVQKDKTVNMKELRLKINSRRLSFASQDDLYKYLQLSQGEVTPLGVLNDESKSVEVILDQDIPEIIGIHPLTNTKTVYMRTKDLIEIIKKHGNRISIVSL